MKRAEKELSGRLLELAQEFDRGFARRAELATRGFEELLALRLAGDPYVLRLSHISGLFANRKIVPLPGPVPELLGLASFRATIVPVYDLCALLGRAREPEPRWLVMTAELPIALGFTDLIGHRRVATSDLLKQDRGSAASLHVPDVARAPEGLYPVIDVSSVVATIRKLTPQGARGKGA